MNISYLQGLIAQQKEFQRLLDIPVDSYAETDILQMAELHCFKAIEELVELRKTFPSTLNKMEKNRPVIDRQRVKEEFVDTLLYMMNFGSLWNFSPEEILTQLGVSQLNNFVKAKEKMMKYLNSEMLMVPGEVVGIGSGNLMPTYVFVGQNPAEGIKAGYQFFANETDGSSKVLIPALREIGILDQCYFTNLVKATTPRNAKPTESMTKFWLQFYDREVKILSYGTKLKIVPMGSWTQKWLGKGISHPASVLYGSTTKDDYLDEIQKFIWQK